MTTGTLKNDNALQAATCSPPPHFDRICERFIGRGWVVADIAPGSPLAPQADSTLDAVLVRNAEHISSQELLTIATALKPLGRLIMAGMRAEETLAQSGAALRTTSRFSLGGGQRAIVAERPGDAGSPGVRRDAHPGAYKMSRYRACHQMQAAMTCLIDAAPTQVLEIGDSNQVIRNMLGPAQFEYFRAHYPPHDLQTLHLIPDSSCDVFICDNTLEHVADPIAGVQQIARVLRPGGWLILFAPFIAMCQDDDRCRWSVRSLSELLGPHFDAGSLGAWGNVDAACWYMRKNKWLRVLDSADGRLICRDQRNESEPLVEVEDRCDRLHPIHVWAVVRRAGGNADPAPKDALLSTYAGLDSIAKDACAQLADIAPSGAIAVYPGDDGTLQDRLAELGRASIGIHQSPLLATSALNRDFASIDRDAPQESFAPDSVTGLLVGPNTTEVPQHIQQMVRRGGAVASYGGTTLKLQDEFEPVVVDKAPENGARLWRKS